MPSPTSWRIVMVSLRWMPTAEFLELAKRHLNPNGIMFYNTTESDRVQRTACLKFAHGARFTNHMIVSEAPIDWNFARWRETLESYAIDGVKQFDAKSPSDRALL